MKKTLIANLLISLFVFSSCIGNTNSTDDSSSYPSMYIEENLPQYPNAIITDSSQGNDFVDGVRVDFETNDSIEDIKNFFETEMANRGFDIPDSSYTTNELTYLNIYTLNNEYCSVQATKVSKEDPSLVSVSCHE